MNATVALLSVAGFGTALLSAVAGIGGGTVLIGVLFAIGLSPLLAVPLHAAVQLVANGTRTLAYLPDVEWRAAGWFLLTGIPAPFLVAGHVASADAHALHLLLAALILASLVPVRGRQSPRLGPRGACLLAGALTGALGMFVGATGVIVGRLFLRPEWPSRTVIGTLALCQSLAHLIKLLAFASVGTTVFEQPALLWPLVLAVVAGTVAGRLLHGRVGDALFRRLFRALLAILAIKLAADGLLGLGA